MNNDDLKRKIKWLSREILAQKQAFQRGLNRTDWSVATATQSNPDPDASYTNFTISITFDTTSNLMPFCQLFIEFQNAELEYSSFAWNSSTKVATYTGYVVFLGDNLSAKAIASDFIQSMSITLTPVA